MVPPMYTINALIIVFYVKTLELKDKERKINFAWSGNWLYPPPMKANYSRFTIEQCTWYLSNKGNLRKRNKGWLRSSSRRFKGSLFEDDGPTTAKLLY